MTFFKFSFVSENHFRNSWYHNLIYEPLSNLQCSLTLNMHLVVSWNIPRGSISSLPPWVFLSGGRVGVGKVATGRYMLLLSPPPWNLQHYKPHVLPVSHKHQFASTEMWWGTCGRNASSTFHSHPPPPPLPASGISLYVKSDVWAAKSPVVEKGWGI